MKYVCQSGERYDILYVYEGSVFFMHTDSGERRKTCTAGRNNGLS